MKYAIIKKTYAALIGISCDFHRCNGVFMIINENELTFSKAEGETLEEKAKNVNAEIVDLNTALRFVK